MKLNLSLLAGVAMLAAVSGAIAQTAVTDPVGYITHTISGNAASNPFGADTLIAATLIQKQDWRASATAVSGTAVTFATPPPAEVTAGSVFEIKDGANEGWWSTVASVSGNTVTLQSAAPASTAATASVSFRKHTTIANLFGAANSAGLTPVVDEIQILDGATQVALPYVYAGAAEGVAPGYYDANGTPSDGVVVPPGASVLVRRKAASNLTLVSVGHVKLGKTTVGVFTGSNWVAPMRATGVTLGNANLDTGVLATGLKRGDGTGAQDDVVFLNDDQSASPYFAADPALGITGMVDPNGADSSAVLISESEGVIIQRKAGSGTMLWTVPGVVVANP